MAQDVQATILELNQRLLNAIAGKDWPTYAELCDPTLTCFEPEAATHLVSGLDFHQFYFKLPGAPAAHVLNTMADPHVRILGNVAILSYYRLTQGIDANGAPFTRGTEETRVWSFDGKKWLHVHFHRSPSQKV